MAEQLQENPSEKPAPETHGKLIAYQLQPQDGWEIEPASATRQWMDETQDKVAYRCLPLSMANQCGWVLKCPLGFTATWDGTPALNGVRVVPDAGEMYNRWVLSHFGSGIITFSIPYLFRTPEGIGLWVRGPTNWIKENITPLDGLVETDWSPFTFTMNWKFHKPGVPVHFARGEPVAMVMPYPMALTEQLAPEMISIDDNPPLKHEYEQFVHSRFDSIRKNNKGKIDAWEKHYMRGTTASGGESDVEHRSRYQLPHFAITGSLKDKQGRKQGG
jgi:Family of unknown function (DUF6065)